MAEQGQVLEGTADAEAARLRVGSRVMSAPANRMAPAVGR